MVRVALQIFRKTIATTVHMSTQDELNSLVNYCSYVHYVPVQCN